MNADGGPLTRLTTLPGGHSATVSPDDQWIADIYSYTNKPPELYVQENRAAGAKAKKLTTSPAPEFWQYPWLDVPIVTFTARDGVQVPRAASSSPPTSSSGGPAVIFVHGAGYLQNVDREWSTVLRARVPVPPHPDGARLHGDRRGLPRLGGLRPRLAHRHLRTHGRQGPGRHRGRRPLAGLRSTAWTPKGSASTAAATADSSP